MVQSESFFEDEQVSNLDEWDDVKIFRDTVHQYIEMPKVYVRYLIDTYDMQRIKDVAQSGLRSVYNTATHDRFSHSLGVYHLGKKAFKSLKKNMENIIESSKDALVHEWVEYQDDLDIWEKLFQVACILHDIGHPAMSHTLEFLYDDGYMYVPGDDQTQKDAKIKVSVDEYRRYRDIRQRTKSNGRLETDFDKVLLQKLNYNENKMAADRVTRLKGNPHERMSAYYIMTGVRNYDTIDQNSLAERIKDLLSSFYYHSRKTRNGVRGDSFSDSKVVEYLQFICRMIIGQEYKCYESDGVDCIKNSAKNAIIRLLNGKIDVDSLDYIARNSYSAGYDTNNIDVNRFCSAFSVRFWNNRFESVFEKSALSILEGFICARNFEPNWLYSHHKVVYNIDVLYKYMYSCVAELLYMEDIEEWADIIGENFYADNKGIETNGFYVKYVKGKAIPENSKESFTKDECEKIKTTLRAMYSDRELLEKVVQYTKDPYDMEIRAEASCIQNILIRTRSTDVSEYNNERKELREHISNCNFPEKFGREVLDYFDSNKELEDELYSIVNIILENSTEEIVESKLKGVMCDARAYLYSLISGDKGGKAVVSMQDKKEFREFILALAHRYSELVSIKSLYFSYILSPFIQFDNRRFIFYRSNDSDIDSLFKTWYFRLKIKENPTRIEKEYCKLGEEYFERQYKCSLWKSYQEYKIFITNIADEINIAFSDVNEYFLNLIEKGAKEILFLDAQQGRINGKFENERIYVYDEADQVRDELALHEKQSFREVFSELKDTDFIIKIHTIKYKDFRNSVKIAFKEKIFLLGEVIEMNEAKEKIFPYIYLKFPVCGNDNKGNQRMEYIDKLGERLKTYCSKKYSENHITKKESRECCMGKVFRDVVHGDIVIPSRFMPLVETSVFQRLRRIKQLSTADLVFTNAEHTRFAHCIGTFHVMTLIVEHFKEIFTELGVRYNEEDIDALLAAALLHDIGHGPYSHNFERLHDESDSSDGLKKHEEWGINIIKNNQEIKEAIETGFPSYKAEGFIHKIISYISMKNDGTEGSRKQLSFSTIYKSLISSQLDADRLDYLLRDSFNTGIGYGNIDVNVIIRGMRVTEFGNKFYVCIAEDNISYIEQFIFGRYKMYDSVYHNAYKVFSETLIIKILQYVKKNPKILNVISDKYLSELLNGTLDVEGYCRLDDSYINGLIAKWQDDDNVILAKMCRSFLERKGYRRLYIMNQGKDDLDGFRKELYRILGIYFADKEKDFKGLNSFIFAERGFDAYKRKNIDSVIWILTNDGLLKDFADVSPMFSAEGKNSNWSSYKSFIYYNKELMNAELDLWKDTDDFEKRKDQLLEDIDQLIDNFNLRNHIEIEEKYSCEPEELAKVEQMLEYPEESLLEIYKISAAKKISQRDIYYDTDDMLLAAKECSFRCRIKGNNGKNKITIKAPTPNGGFDKESQVARFEYEKEIDGEDISSAADFVGNIFCDIFPKDSPDISGDTIKEVFKEQLEVYNERSKYLVSNALGNDGGFQFSVCLDRVTFKCGDKAERDYQIEVELESDYMHRVSMKFFTKEIENLLNKPIKHEQYSKYMKGLVRLGKYHPFEE